MSKYNFDQSADGVELDAPAHDARRYGDQLHCHICGKQWDVDEPAPACVSRQERGLQQIQKLKEVVKCGRRS